MSFSATCSVIRGLGVCSGFDGWKPRDPAGIRQALRGQFVETGRFPDTLVLARDEAGLGGLRRHAELYHMQDPVPQALPNGLLDF